MLVDELILVMAEDGDVALVEATPEAFRELGRFEVLGDKTWNNPALTMPNSQEFGTPEVLRLQLVRL